MAQTPLSADDDDETKFVGVKFAESQLAKLDELAKRRKSNRSRLIREAVAAYVAADQREAATG